MSEELEKMAEELNSLCVGTNDPEKITEIIEKDILYKIKLIEHLREQNATLQQQRDKAVECLELVQQHYHTLHWLTNKHEAQSKRGMKRKVKTTLKQIKGE